MALDASGGGTLTWCPRWWKHSEAIAREDALHAIGNAYYVAEEFDEPPVPGHLRPTLFIGPPRQLGGPLLEVMVEIIPPRDLLVFPVMPARQKHLNRIEDSL